MRAAARDFTPGVGGVTPGVGGVTPAGPLRYDAPGRSYTSDTGGYTSDTGGYTSDTAYVFWMTMFGNLAEKSSAFWATKIATLRAMAL